MNFFTVTEDVLGGLDYLSSRLLGKGQHRSDFCLCPNVMSKGDVEGSGHEGYGSTGGSVDGEDTWGARSKKR